MSQYRLDDPPKSPPRILATKRDHDDLCIVPGCGRMRYPPSRYCRIHDFAGRSDGLMGRPLK